MYIKDIQKKSSEGFTFLYGETETDYPGIPQQGAKIMEQLIAFIKNNKVEVSGPVVWTYRHLGNGKVMMKAGYTVNPETQSGEGLFVEKVPLWDCMSARFDGSFERITHAWDEFSAELKKQGYPEMPECREVYHHVQSFDSEENVTELQVKLSENQ